jgi:hypothetical protein
VERNLKAVQNAPRFVTPVEEEEKKKKKKKKKKIKGKN